MHLELIQTERGYFTVIVDGQFADRLCPDEALGVVAAAIYRGCTRLPYVQSYEQWDRFDQRYRHKDDPRPPTAGLLTWNGSPRHLQH